MCDSKHSFGDVLYDLSTLSVTRVSVHEQDGSVQLDGQLLLRQLTINSHFLKDDIIGHNQILTQKSPIV